MKATRFDKPFGSKPQKGNKQFQTQPKVSSVDPKTDDLRTLDGKQRSTSNAPERWLLGESVVLPEESASDFQALLNELRDSMRPCGLQEHWELEKLAILRWRLRRALRAERVMISGQVQFSPAIEDMCMECLADIDRELGMLTQLRHQIEGQGLNQEADLKILKEIYGDWASEGVDPPELPKIYQRMEEIIETEFATLDSPPSRSVQEMKPIFFLLVIEQWTENLNEKKKWYDVDEKLKLAVDRASIPNKRDLDCLLRYETHLYREIERSQNRLERLQRMRRGER